MVSDLPKLVFKTSTSLVEILSVLLKLLESVWLSVKPMVSSLPKLVFINSLSLNAKVSDLPKLVASVSLSAKANESVNPPGVKSIA